MKLKLIPFGIAREIMDTDESTVTVDHIKTAGELKKYLEKKYERLHKLQHFRLAVNEEYRDSDYVLSENDEVVIIPPVSGG